MKRKLKTFMHYWLDGMILAVAGGFVFWLASIPAKLLHAKWGDETGAMIVDSYWKGLIALAELLLIPFLFGWLLHRIITRPNGIVRLILSDWIRESQSEQDEAEQSLGDSENRAKDDTVPGSPQN